MRTQILQTALLALVCATASAQSSDDPNLKGSPSTGKMEKQILRDKETRAAPGADHSDANRKYEEAKKDEAKKAEEKAKLREKYDKEKNK